MPNACIGSEIPYSGRMKRYILLFGAIFYLSFSPCSILAQTTTYRVVPDFPQLPAGWALGGVSGVAVNSHGQVIIFHRGDHPLIILAKEGKFIRSLGEGWFTSPHGLRIDQQDNLWVTDVGNHTVTKISQEGKVLLSLGTKNTPGEDATHFDKPTDVAVAPNGDFYVSDGYGNSRVVKFDAGGKLLRVWGKKGAAEGEFNLPHAVCLNSAGQVWVADRENNRVQVFNANGRFQKQFTGFAPFGLYVLPDSAFFVADGRAHRVSKISAEGKILTSWGRQGSGPGELNLPHGITVDAEGSVYVAEIDGKRVQKFRPQF